MVLKFGTSGVRGLVSEMTDKACYLYTTAFVQYLKESQQLNDFPIAVAGDLRSSTPRIMRAVATAISHQQHGFTYAGFIPTCAVSSFGFHHQAPSIMVTGSHIPDDRNGIKFNMPTTEVLKRDEKEISVRYTELLKQDFSSLFDENDMLKDPVDLGSVDIGPRDLYVARYVQFFPENCLKGETIVVYQHSAVIREMLPEIFERLGAKVIPVAFSDEFIPVDTEAVRKEDLALAKEIVAKHSPFATVSADGDSDRPLIFDEQGEFVRGDVLGVLVAKYLSADAVVTTASANTVVEKVDSFDKIIRTKIGSPYVISGMQEAAEHGAKRVVGYESNGGFLTQTPIEKNGRTLEPLPTRDAVLPMLALVMLAKDSNMQISQLVGDLPQRFTYSAKLAECPREKSLALLDRFQGQSAPREVQEFFGLHDGVEHINYKDGVRIILTNGQIFHFRPSGNAPELRCYTETDSEKTAKEFNDFVLGRMKEHISQ